MRKSILIKISLAMAAVIFIACLAAGCGAQGGSGDTGVPKVGSLKYEGQITLYENTEPRVSCYLLRLYPCRPEDLMEWGKFFLFSETSFGNTGWNSEWRIYKYPF